jgi:hypothetical protein
MRIIVAFALALAPAALVAQQPARLGLAAPAASLSEEFSNLTWARELQDGRVLIMDSREGRVVGGKAPSPPDSVGDLSDDGIERLRRHPWAPVPAR